jgi:hypothetical protein
MAVPLLRKSRRWTIQRRLFDIHSDLQQVAISLRPIGYD